MSEQTMGGYGYGYSYYPIDHYARVLRVVQDCEAVCENTATAVLCKCDKSRVMQLYLLRDCADICTLTAKYIARCSMYARTLARLCADICEACGNHCLKHPDPESQYCGRVCLDCAKECRAFAGQTGYPGPGYGYNADMPGVYSEPEKKEGK